MLGWSQAQLAEAAHVSRQHTPIGNNLASIVAAFEKAGIDFIPENGGGAGIRFKKRT
jgi:hypothetical protein